VKIPLARPVFDGEMRGAMLGALQRVRSLLRRNLLPKPVLFKCLYMAKIQSLRFFNMHATQRQLECLYQSTQRFNETRTRRLRFKT